MGAEGARRKPKLSGQRTELSAVQLLPALLGIAVPKRIFSRANLVS